MTDERKPRMIPACDAGPIGTLLEKNFPDLRCDREQDHPLPHRMRRGPFDADWWCDGCIGKEEGLVLEVLRERERRDARRRKAEERRRKAEERKAKRRDTKTDGMFKEPER